MKHASHRVIPMIHVPNVEETANWYVSIGFTLIGENREDGEMNWAKVALGDSAVMFSIGGRESAEQRREVDLYITCEDVSALYERLKVCVEVVEELHETEYGMREFLIRDINRFWITFGQPTKS